MCSVIHFELTQSPKAGGWRRRSCVCGWLVQWLPSYPVLLCPGVCDLCHCSGVVNFGSLYTQWKQMASDCCKCNFSLWAKSCDKGPKPKHTHLFWMEVAIYMQEVLDFWGISHASYFFVFVQGRNFVCFLVFHCHCWVAIPQRKGFWKHENKGIVGLIPPGAAQYFSFVKAECPKLLVCRDPLMSKCWNVWWEKIGLVVLFFFTCFQVWRVYSIPVAFLFVQLTCCFTDLFAQIPLNCPLFSL